MAQDELKQQVAKAAAAYVAQHVAAGAIIGVGTGSTASFFIDELAAMKSRIAATVASSEATRRRLEGHGFQVIDLNEASSLPIYVDGADEIDPGFAMIKGGGGALTREKIIAAVADVFVCICDASKQVETLGRFALPVEVIPMARAHVARELVKIGGEPRLREGFVTDNGNQILDVHGLTIAEPARLETAINQIVGVVANGLFACRPADVLLVGAAAGVQQRSRA